MTPSLWSCLLTLPLLVSDTGAAPRISSMEALASTAVGARSQTADLSGRWRRQSTERSGADFEAFEPDSEQIVQAAQQLDITRQWAGRIEHLRYLADGVERDDDRFPPGAARVQSHWDADRLVTTFTRTVALPRGSVSVVVREVRAIEGGLMTVETTWTSGDTTKISRAQFVPVVP